MHRLQYCVIKRCDQSHSRAVRALMINFQTAAMGNDRSPNILVGQSFADLPRLAQEADLAIGRHAPNEVNTTGREGQFRWEGADLPFCQSLPLSANSRAQVLRDGP